MKILRAIGIFFLVLVGLPVCVFAVLIPVTLHFIYDVPVGFVLSSYFVGFATVSAIQWYRLEKTEDNT